MKRCPECRRDYYDDSLLYCLDDGSALLEGPASMDEPATAVLPAVEAGNGWRTAIMQMPDISSGKVGASIAVLPFAHLSSAPDDEYFCDGLAEELINALTKIESIKVAARTSAFSFKGTNTKASDIGRALNVNKILEGSVRKARDQVRITVQLVNAVDGYQIWSERYDREMKDIFAVQDEITLAVVDALKVKLLGAEKAVILKKATASPEAYEMYLRGRFFWNRRTIGDFERAIEQFQLAIKIDPAYALAYSGLADCLLFLGYYEGFSPAEAGPKAREAVTTALAMDDSLAEAHASMAMYKCYFEFDWKAAEDGLRKAIELNPKLPTARYWLCSFLDAMGRFDESIEQGRIAHELDPLELITPNNIVRTLTHAGRYDQAVELAQKTLEIAPEFYVTHWALGVVHLKSGRLDKALEPLRYAAEKSGLLFLNAYYGFALAMSGKTDVARQILVKLHAENRRRYISPACMSMVYIGLGEIGTALDLLEEAWNARTVLLMWMKVEPVFDPLRDEPRFKELLQKVGLPE